MTKIFFLFMLNWIETRPVSFCPGYVQIRQKFFGFQLSIGDTVQTAGSIELFELGLGPPQVCWVL